jgi:hypothetical protein
MAYFEILSYICMERTTKTHKETKVKMDRLWAEILATHITWKLDIKFRNMIQGITLPSNRINLTFGIGLCNYVQLRLMFTLLLISFVHIRYVFRPNWPSSCVQVVRLRQLVLPLQHDGQLLSRELRLQQKWTYLRLSCNETWKFNYQNYKLNTCMTAARCQLKKRTRGSSSYLERPTCISQGGQLSCVCLQYREEEGTST